MTNGRRFRMSISTVMAAVCIAAAAAIVPNPAAATSVDTGHEPDRTDVVIADSSSVPDMGIAVVTASRLGAVFLIAEDGSLPYDALSLMAGPLQPSRIVLVGDKDTLPEELEVEIASYLHGSDFTIERLSAATVPDLAVKAAAPKYAGDYEYSGAVVVNGWSASDVPVAAAYAARSNYALLYSGSKSMTTKSIDAIADLEVPRIVIVGGPQAVPDSVESRLSDLKTSEPVRRLAGLERLSTASSTALSYSVGYGATVIVADGWDRADMAIAASLSASTNNHLLLRDKDAIGTAVESYISRYSPRRVIFVGTSPQDRVRLLAQLESLPTPVPVVTWLTGESATHTALLAQEVSRLERAPDYGSAQEYTSS